MLIYIRLRPLGHSAIVVSDTVATCAILPYLRIDVSRSTQSTIPVEIDGADFIARKPPLASDRKGVDSGQVFVTPTADFQPSSRCHGQVT
jgi:hypothetical protein